MFGLRTHLARRLMLYITSCVLAALLITVATQIWALQPLLEQTRNRNVDAAIDNLVGLITQSLWVFNQDAAVEAANAMLRDQFISGIIVNDHAGLFEYRGGDLAQTDFINPELSESIRTDDGQAVTITLPLVVTAEGNTNREFNIGTLQIRSDDRLISEQLTELTNVTLVVSGLIIIALHFLIYFFVRITVARPLELVTKHVQQYAANMDLAVQGGTELLEKRDDEIGRLYRLFNQQRKDLINRDQSLNEYRDRLEQTVAERTSELREANTTLITSLDQLKRAQAELIQNEKLVSLGTLVSGIAHEVNTPLGIAITASSHLRQELDVVTKAQTESTLNKSSFEQFLAECSETETLLANNLQRAATLIQSFKKVAVDQSSDEVRFINLHHYIDEIVLSLGPRLKKAKLEIINRIPTEFEFSTYPGALAQITTNLILNSIIHGFNNGKQSGKISFDASRDGNMIHLAYSDNGVGMDKETLSRIYDPFYTTKRSEGGSGLGMNIVYNLITSKLNGSIETQSEPDRGMTVVMTFPFNEDTHI